MNATRCTGPLLEGQVWQALAVQAWVPEWVPAWVLEWVPEWVPAWVPAWARVWVQAWPAESRRPNTSPRNPLFDL